MNEPTLGRLLGLVEKTGDKVIVTDPAGERPYVLMSLDQYERLLETSRPIAVPSPRPQAPVPMSAPKPVMPTPKPVVPKPLHQSAQGPAVQGFTKPADLWRSKLGLDAAEPPVRNLFTPKPRPIPVAKPVQEPEPTPEFAVEAEGEEQFYLEPLE